MTRTRYLKWQFSIRSKRKAQPVFVTCALAAPLVAVRHCKMPNGDRRYVTVKPGTLQSAKVKIGRKTVSGRLTYQNGDYAFHPNPDGKNAHLLAV